MTGSHTVIKKAKRVRATYSDLPIQVAERAVSRQEFIEELTNDAGENIALIFHHLNNALSKVRDLKDDNYSFNEILKRGAVSLEFQLIHHLKAHLVGLFSVQHLDVKVILDRKVDFELRVDGFDLTLENLNGAFVRVVDKGKSYRAEITNVSIQDTVDGSVMFLVDCHYFPTQSGNSNVLLLMILIDENQIVGMSSPVKAKKASMKKFRQSYANLESMSHPVSSTKRARRSFAKLNEWIKTRLLGSLKP